MTAVRNFLRIFQCLRRVWEQGTHLLLRFDKVLPALIPHTVLIGKLFPCLQAEQNIMRICIFRIRIMDIVRGNEFDPRLPGKSHQLLVDKVLLRNAMILKLQKKIAFSKNTLVPESRLFCLFVKVSYQILCHLSGKAGRKSNESFLILLQNFQIYPGLIIKAIHKSGRDNFHQIGIALIVFRQKHQMIISVLSFPVSRSNREPGVT